MYVAAWQDIKSNKVIVLERENAGKLIKKEWESPFYFYVSDENGDRKSMYKHRVKRVDFKTRKDMFEAKEYYDKKGLKVFETDFSPVQRILADHYYEKSTPTVNFCFIDIEYEVDNAIKKIHKKSATPSNPYAPINAITIYQSWSKKYFTLAVPPKNWDGDIKQIYDKFDELIKQENLRNIIPEIIICKDERELLVSMVKYIANADIYSGWNSEFFDIPYIIERMKLMGGESVLSTLEYPYCKSLPKAKTVLNFGKPELAYDFTAKTHLDYMKVFKKFAGGGSRVSYKLKDILYEEVGLSKLDFDGGFEKFYNEEFETFVAYNFRDVDGLVELENKLNLIRLVNQMAHENTSLYPSLLGTTAYVSSAVINHAHYKHNVIIPDKAIIEEDDDDEVEKKKVEGAIVLTPKVGLHENIGSIDINSLYPSIIRSLGISPEKIVGQFIEKEKAWKNIVYQINPDMEHLFICDNGEEIELSAQAWEIFLKDNKYSISAYGTVFDQSEDIGIIPSLLGFWYSERKRLQAELKKTEKYLKENKETLTDNDILALEHKIEEYDLLQYTKKIQLNSLYGALLSKYFRFNDERMGASVTASGRAVATHMGETVSNYFSKNDYKLIKTTEVENNGKVHHNYHIDCPYVLYMDTDSTYFKCKDAKSLEHAVEIADDVRDTVNNSFDGFMRKAFNCQSGYDNLIRCAREIVASRGIFQAKKKYILKIFDKEGKRDLAGKDIKSMGSEIKKSDTPKIIQKFLKKMVDMILCGADMKEVTSFVLDQRKQILTHNISMWSLGVAKQVNNMEKYVDEYNNKGSNKKKTGKTLTVPGHVRAAFNFNKVLETIDPGAQLISSGDKVVVFSLKPNMYEFETIALPSDLSNFPEWFSDYFVVDKKKTESALIDSKIEGIFTSIGEETPTFQSEFRKKVLVF